jgi:hypothetical protein
MRGVAWLEPPLQAKISYSEMMHLVEHGEAFEHDDASLRRFRCRAGAPQSGNRDKARQHFTRLIELAGSGDLRPEMEWARRYLASN